MIYIISDDKDVKDFFYIYISNSLKSKRYYFVVYR